MKIKIGSDGGKTCQFLLTGEIGKIETTPEPILSFANLKPPARGLRLDGLQFGIQEKAGVKLWWTLPEKKFEFLIVLESRGGFDFEKIHPIPSPEGAIGLAYTTFKVSEPRMHALIMMDFSKL